MKDDFSFLKLREQIISKSGVAPTATTKEQLKKLKFEPNINVQRSMIVDNSDNRINKPSNEIEEIEKTPTAVNISESKNKFYLFFNF